MLDAMRALSLEGVRSVAVVEEDAASSGGPGGGSEAGHLTLLSTVSVTDIGKVR